MNSFRYKCHQSLNTTFGRVDSIVECIELSIRDFVLGSKSAANLEQYIGERASINNIRVNTVDVQHLVTRAAQLHILSVYQQFEGYLESLKNEIPFALQLDSGNESLFKMLLRALNDKYGLISQHEIEVFEYYRNMRNVFMHPEIETSKYDKIQERIKSKIESECPELRKYDAPNKYDELQFDDFILFTKVAKDMAEKFCVIGCPSVTDIATLIRNTKHYKQLNKYRGNNKKRFVHAAQTLCRCEYSLDANDSESVVNELWALA